MRTERPFGTWSSPLGAAAVAAGALQLELVALDDADLYWIERRPSEGGRQVVVRYTSDGVTTDMTPPHANARTRVHEYGGGACAVDSGIVYYSNFSDQRIYQVEVPGESTALTPPGEWRYADFIVDRRQRRLICVREDHSRAGTEPHNALVAVPIDGPATCGTIIEEGYDFYSAPRLSPRGDQLSWICWRHPQMPWDGAELHVASLDSDGRFVATRHVAGGVAEAIVQAMWSPDGTLYFISDRSGWWNLYRMADGGVVEPLMPMDADFARPPWEFGQALWAFAGPDRMVGSYAVEGVWRVAVLDIEARTLTNIAHAPEPGNVLLATPAAVFYVGRSPTAPDAVVRVSLSSREVTALRSASKPLLDRRFISVPVPIVFPTDEGETARLFYYAPEHPDVEAPRREKPPLIVIIHGGPTSAAMTRLNLATQFWTTRGFAVADVDYRGSSGFGRAYRERIIGEWGNVDVADCVNAARYLADQGLADRDRLIIRGASAGGFTMLAALTFRPGVFKAGACYYGIGDLEALARDTHKFESRYTDRLIAPYPDRVDLYRDRSPIHAVDRLSCPVIFFHGREDVAVPVNQAEMMVHAMRERGVRADLFVFEGEQHGFRRRETIERCLEAELQFYAEVFGFEPSPG